MTRLHQRRATLLEWVLVLPIVGGLCYAIYHLFNEHYLPQPFFYDAADTWMDWFNTSFWGRDKGVYDNWGSIYPPLTFLVLDVLGIARCYPGAEGYTTRDCDWLGAVAIHAIYALNIFLVGKSLLKQDRRTAAPRSIAICCGLPMFHALDRANPILLTFSCFVLAYGPLLRSARARWLAVALAINFKIYLLPSVFAPLIRRRWLWVECAFVTTILLYVASIAIYGRGTPADIYANVVNYSGGGQFNSLLDIWFAATYQPVLGLLGDSNYPIMGLIGSWRTEYGIIAIETAVSFVKLTILAALVAAWLRPEAIPTYRLVNLVTGLALISVESGGYTQIFVVFLTMLEPWKGIGRRMAITAVYLLSIPSDYFIDPLPPIVRPGWLNGPYNLVAYWITAGPFIRPAVFLLVPLCLAIATIRQVWRDVWAQRWQDRWRFRHDIPLFMGAGTFRRRSEG